LTYDGVECLHHTKVKQKLAKGVPFEMSRCHLKQVDRVEEATIGPVKFQVRLEELKPGEVQRGLHLATVLGTVGTDKLLLRMNNRVFVARKEICYTFVEQQ
jgi:hypothetical protein